MTALVEKPRRDAAAIQGAYLHTGQAKQEIARELRHLLGRASREFGAAAARSGGLGGEAGGGYEGARTDRFTENWNPRTLSADAQLLQDLGRLRDRTRDLVANEPLAASLIDVKEQNVIGCGIRVQARATAEETGLGDDQVAEWNAACEREWSYWSRREADATEYGTSNQYGELQRLLYRAWKVDGDGFGHFVMVKDDPARRYSLALETIEGDRVDTPPALASKPNVRLGVELGERRQPLRYFVSRQHPGDRQLMRSGLEFVPIERKRNGRLNMLHVFKRDRVEQTRGMPSVAPSLTTVRSYQQYFRAEQVAAHISACIGLIIKKTLGPEAGGIEWDEAESSFIEGLWPGMVQYLGEGEDVVPFAPQRPGTTFDAFVSRILRSIAAQSGVPYELLVKDFTKGNYSNTRTGLLEMRRGFRCEQALMIGLAIQPTYELVIEEAYLRGYLPPVPDFYGMRDALTRTRCIPPAGGWVDPTKEIQASRDAIGGLLSTFEDESTGNGSDFEENARSVARSLQFLIKLEKEHGLPDGALTAAFGAAKPAPPAAPPGAEKDPEGEETKDPEETDDEEDGA